MGSAGGTHVAPSRFQLFTGGSASGVTVVVLVVLSNALTAAFHVPKTALGGMPVPPNCQSPARGLLEPGNVSKSVMNSAGNIGRPDGSTPPWASVAPVCGFITHVGVAVGAGAGTLQSTKEAPSNVPPGMLSKKEVT